MLIKKRYLFLIIIICMFTISSVNAIDNETQTLSLTSNDELVSLNDNDEILTVNEGTYSELASEIGFGGNITLTKDVYTYDSGDTINIMNSGTIDGKGAIIDMAGAPNIRVFNITTNHVIIKDISLKNANGISFNNVFNCSIINCSFLKCFSFSSSDNSESMGGAIYFNGNGTISDCSFVDCCANSSSNYVDYNSCFSEGGAIYFSGSSSIVNCSFVNCRTNCNSYSENKNSFCFSSGGAIFLNYGTSIVTGCNFINCSSSSYNPSHCIISSQGGAIYLGHGNVSDCSFVNCSTNSSYGSISSHVPLSSEGGAIYLNGKDVISDCSFINCSCFSFNFCCSRGGAICYSDAGNVFNCSFLKCFGFSSGTNSESFGGAIYLIEGNISDCSFVNCFGQSNAYRKGGAIYFFLANLSDCSFMNCSNEEGGAVYSEYLNNISDCSFVNCNSRWGGAIYNRGSGSIFNSTFMNCKALYGGSIYFWDNGLNITNSIFIEYKIDDKIYYNVSKSVLNNEKIIYGKSDYNIINCTLIQTSLYSINIYAPNVTKYYGGNERFIIIVNDIDNNPLANILINITINGESYNRTTNENGQTSIALRLNPDKYDVTTSHGDIIVKSTVIIKNTVIANDFTKIFRNGTQYYGTFTDSQGNLLKNTQVRFNINGVFYTRTTNENGIAKMNINLNPGTYILTATNPVNGENLGTTIKVLPNIVENHDLTKYYRNASQFTFKLLDDRGNPVAGQKASININGVFYTRTTNDKGIATFQINLEPGTYILTIEYKGCRVSNRVTVLSILQAKDLNMKFRDGSKFEAKLLDGQGNPFAGQKITFNINGVFYDRTTDENGIARLNINLQADNYIITSSYNGLNIANNIKISNDPIYYTIGSNPLVSDEIIHEIGMDCDCRLITDIYGNTGMHSFVEVVEGITYWCYRASTDWMYLFSPEGVMVDNWNVAEHYR